MLSSNVAPHKGSPAIFVNGEPILPAMAIGADRFATTDGYLEAGVRIYQTFRCSDDIQMGWDGEDRFDYSADEQMFAGILKDAPQGLILPVVGYIDSVPQKWMENHACELTRLNTKRFGKGPSPASEAFTATSEDVIRRYIRHFEDSEFRDRIVGYHVVNGCSFEWLAWDWFQPDIIGFDDYSRPMQTAFRSWLRLRYANNLQALRDAWKNADVTFDSADIPTALQRIGKPGEVLPGPDDGLQARDYNVCYAETWAEQTLRFCRAAKEAVDLSKIVAVFNGYNRINCHDTYIQCIGHLAFSKLLADPSIDVFMAPYSYENRGIDGCHFPQVCESTFALHGKVFMDQIDTRTAIVTPKQPQWGQCETVEQSVEMMKRDMGTIVTHGLAVQHYDMQNTINCWGAIGSGRHWYDHPDLRGMQVKLGGLLRKALRGDSRSNADIAVLIDNGSLLLQRLNRGFGSLYITAQHQYEFDKLSTPLDCYLLEDLPRLRDYKLYIFLNAFDLTNDVAAGIRERIHEQGASALYFYAPGCYHNGILDLAGVQDRVGIALGMDNRRDFIHMDITDRTHPFTAALGKRLDYGSEIDPEAYRRTTAYFPDNRELFKFTPIFHADDPKARTLGVLRTNKRPGLCVKPWGKGTVVYSAAPLMPARLIRAIAANAGVHLYTDEDDLVYANRNFVFVTSRTDGPKQIRLPRACDVADALTERSIARQTTEIDIDMRKNETRILELR